MPVLPALQEMLDAIPDQTPLQRNSEGRRAVHAQIAEQLVRTPLELGSVTVEDQLVPVDGASIDVRIYRPTNLDSVPGAHMFVHGGGWWMGTLDQSDHLCANAAVKVGCVVVSVDHRKAPEHRFPTQVHDVDDALTWLVTDAERLGIDRDKISVGGQSSGANLVAAMTLLRREDGRSQPIAQVLEIGAFDLTLSQPSVHRFASGYLLSLDEYLLDLEAYIPPDQRTSPYASPALADDLGGLPPAYISTAEYDLLRDDGEMYARRLAAAGARVKFRQWEGHVHGSNTFINFLPEARLWQDSINGYLRGYHSDRTESQHRS
jgi:acetyl esterase